MPNTASFGIDFDPIKPCEENTIYFMCRYFAWMQRSVSMLKSCLRKNLTVIIDVQLKKNESSTFLWKRSLIKLFMVLIWSSFQEKVKKQHCEDFLLAKVIYMYKHCMGYQLLPFMHDLIPQSGLLYQYFGCTIYNITC